MNIQKLNEILRVFEIIRQDFSSNTKRKNLFLCTCIVLDPDINLKEMDQKFPFGGLIGYGNSCMDYFFANSKIFRLHAILHDSAGSVKSITKKVLGIVMLHLVSPVHAFLVTCLDYFSVYMLKYLLHQYMHCLIVNRF